jgi:ribose-phosphate pyrophosphokinase
MIKIIAGTNQEILATNLSQHLNYHYVVSEISKYQDQEYCIKIAENLQQHDVIIIAATATSSANDRLMELLLLADAARHADAGKIVAIMPYYGYARESNLSAGAPLSAQLVAKLLEAASIDKIITIDLHTDKIKDFFNIPVINLYPTGLFMEHLTNIENAIVIAPDHGAINRASVFSHKLGLALGVMEKTRQNSSSMHNLNIEVAGKNCIIIDDIIDSGNTIVKATELLISRGAKSVIACVTHGVFSNEANLLIQKSAIEKIYLTNSIINNHLSEKCRVADIVNLLITALQDNIN